MRLSPDEMIFWQHGFLKLNGTIVFTWGLMFVMAIGSKLITRNLSTELKRSRWQNLLEIVVTGIEKQIEDVGLRHPKKYIGFLGTLFLFVAISQPLHHHSRLRTADGIALYDGGACAVRVCGCTVSLASRSKGWVATSNPMRNRQSSCCRLTSSANCRARWHLAVRLFGNMMSGTMIFAILLTITPFIFPIAMSALGLLTGMVQAYIFSILAAVYIAAATRGRKSRPEPTQDIKA